jgi:hypothetical protein
VTVTVAVCPGVRMVPFETPLALNPAPCVVNPEIVTFEFPVLVSVKGRELEVFRFTVPKLKLVGFALRVSAVATPVPLRLMVMGEGLPFVASRMVPLIAPAPDGANTALNIRLPPATIVDDVVKPLTLIPAPATVMLENESVALPLFVSWMG